jgi:hypothetical protein
MIRQRIINRDTLVSELSQQAENTIGPWLEQNELNFASVILLSMRIVEEYCVKTASMESGDKLKAALDIIPIIVDIATKSNKMSPEEAAALKFRVNQDIEIVKQTISMYILVSKNPEFIQAVEAIKEEIRGCCIAVKNKCNK